MLKPTRCLARIELQHLDREEVFEMLKVRLWSKLLSRFKKKKLLLYICFDAINRTSPERVIGKITSVKKNDVIFYKVKYEKQRKKIIRLIRIVETTDTVAFGNIVGLKLVAPEGESKWVI